MKRRPRKAQRPSSVLPAYSAAMAYTKFFIVSVATTFRLSPSVYAVRKRFPNTSISTDAASGAMPQDRDLGATALLDAGERRQGRRIGSDPGMSVQDVDPLALAHPGDQRPSRRDDRRRVVPLNAVRERGSALKNGREVFARDGHHDPR